MKKEYNDGNEDQLLGLSYAKYLSEADTGRAIETTATSRHQL